MIIVIIRIIRKKIYNFYLFNRYPIAKEFVKFCLVGFLNLLVDMSVYWIATRIFGLFYILAAVLAFIVAVTFSFFINRSWTFRYQGTDLKLRYARFFVANLIAIAINLILLYLLVDIVGIYDIWAKLIITVVMSFFNFSLNKFWTFRVN